MSTIITIIHVLPWYLWQAGLDSVTMVLERLSSIASILGIVAGCLQVKIWSYGNVLQPCSSSTGIYNSATTFAQRNTNALITYCLSRVHVDIARQQLGGFSAFSAMQFASTPMSTRSPTDVGIFARWYLTPVTPVLGLHRLCAAHNGMRRNLYMSYVRYGVYW